MDRITPESIEQRIADYIVDHSGFEKTRSYLSVSHLTECPRKIVREFREGFRIDEFTHRMCYAGYEQQDNMMKLLRLVDYIEKVEVEVVADFDPRLKGHMDAVGMQHVIELKSISKRKWGKMMEKDRALWEHYVQVQLYMRYSGLRSAFVTYRNRETYEHKVYEVPYNAQIAAKYEEKAKEILHAIDTRTLPECVCGHCG